MNSHKRKAEHDIDGFFLERWSPRALSGEEIETEELLTLFEAARWAPSCYNNQPWRFIYARRGTPAWPAFFKLLSANNRVWAQRAAALVVIASKKTFDDGKSSRTHSFDAGSAWMSLALQGSLKGLVVHGMEGFDYAKAAAALGIPRGYQVEAMVAVGRPGRKEDLPPDMRAKEFPSGRKKVAQFAFEGKFRG